MEPVGPAHAEALAAIHARAFPAGEAWDARAFAGLLATPGVSGFVHPDGGMILLRAAGDEAEILTFGVVPEARRRGLGRALLRRARVAFPGAVFLEVSRRNSAAMFLYCSEGFEPVGERRGYYADGADAVVMRCRGSAVSGGGGMEALTPAFSRGEREK